MRDRRFPQVFTKRVAGATSDHGSWTLCPWRAHGPCADTEDPQCGGNLPSASRTFRDCAVNGVLENLVTSGLGEVLLQRDVGSAMRILVDAAKVGREEKTMAEECPKYLHQSNGTSENAVKGIETSVTTSDCVLPEWFGCQVDSESIAPSRIVGCAAHVPSQSDDHNVRVRTRRSRAELMLKVRHVRGEMGKLDPSSSEMHSQTLQVCTGIPRNWRGS